jgi:L-lactate dehydrogenase complex protein LldG
MDTSTARQAIFTRIRDAQKRPAQVTQSERDAVSAYLEQHTEGPRPHIGHDLVQRFKEQALRMSDTIDEVAMLSDVPAAVAKYLDSINVAKQAIGWTTLSKLDWVESGIQMEFRSPKNDDLVGITDSFCAVAETGTLMLLSGPDSNVSASLLPETHIAIVFAPRIVAAMEDAFALARAECGELPRTVNFISGPSRTGDIEQTIVLGAHGPYRVHVIIVHQA